jgi:hypothetical protein
MSNNEIKAKILTIGRQLERVEWHLMKVPEAEAWCKKKAQEAGVTSPEDLAAIAMGAMAYVLEGGSTAEHPGAALDESEIDAETEAAYINSHPWPEIRRVAEMQCGPPQQAPDGISTCSI